MIFSLAVILYVFRVLKDSDFQPNIALVTRTIANIVSQLFHFFILFSIVSCGYAFAGVLLFGHQYDAFSSISDSLCYIIMILIAFNPDEGWVQVSKVSLCVFGQCCRSLGMMRCTQMTHAAPTWAFNIYLWSWILIACFILVRFLWQWKRKLAIERGF